VSVCVSCNWTGNINGCFGPTRADKVLNRILEFDDTTTCVWEGIMSVVANVIRSAASFDGHTQFVVLADSMYTNVVDSICSSPT
jgi:hypothetical protein